MLFSFVLPVLQTGFHILQKTAELIFSSDKLIKWGKSANEESKTDIQEDSVLPTPTLRAFLFGRRLFNRTCRAL